MARTGAEAEPGLYRPGGASRPRGTGKGSDAAHGHSALLRVGANSLPPGAHPWKGNGGRRLRSAGRGDSCAYVGKFLAPGTGVVASGIQGSQAFALYENMLPTQEREAALEHLVRDITDEHNGHLTTGIFGTQFMLDVLSREGRAEVVNTMVNLRGFPGWGHMLDHGATTLWEHWQFSDNTFSHNHPMFGSVSQWLYNWPGGIEPAPDAVAFDKFTLQPQFLKGLDWVRCTYHSVRGPVTCDWKREEASVAMDLGVPVNTTATLILPAGVITENGRPLLDLKGVKIVSDRVGHSHVKLESGQYHFLFKSGTRQTLAEQSWR